MFDVAKHSFDLPESFLNKFKGTQPDFGPIGLFTFKRTYARTIEGEDRTEEYWETVKRIVEGTFSIQKNHCKRNHLPWNERKAQRTAKKMFEMMWSFKFLPPGRGMWAMGTDYVAERGGACLNNPLGLDTKVLTKEYGWITLDQLETNEKVTVLTTTKRYGADAEHLSSSPYCSSQAWSEGIVSPIEEQSCRRIWFEDKGGKRTAIDASLNHRWHRCKNTKQPWERVTTEDLRVGDYVPIVKPTMNFKPCVTGYQHGFFFGDGTRSNGELHQFNDSAIVLRELFGDRAEDVKNSQDKENNRTHAVVRQCPLAWGSIPTEEYCKDRRYLFGFLAGYFAADGSVRDDGLCTIDSARHDELCQVIELFTDLGIRVSNTPYESIAAGSNNLVDNRNPLYRIDIDPVDLREDFFLQSHHLERWKNNVGERRRDWARVVGMVPIADDIPVRCIEVPGYEQFVIDGFLLTSNCGFVSTDNIADEPTKWAEFIMDMSMVGVGVGFDTRGADKRTIGKALRPEILSEENLDDLRKLFKLSEPDALELRGSTTYFVVPDTREGWVDSLRILLLAYACSLPLPKWDFSKVRPAGLPIKGFGGTSSGPEPLQEMLADIQDILESRAENTLTSSDIVDIGNLIGRCVVAGNVRRSAEIIFGDPLDETFSLLKQDKEKLTHHRWASNNSIFATVGMDYGWHARQTAVNGEPGYMWMDNARAFGRMKDPADWADRDAVGGNPCLEQTLHNFELCTLVETFPSRHETLDEYLETLKIAYLYAKTVTLVPTHWTETNAVMAKNRRIGLSQSGIIKAFNRHGRREIFRWCDKGYEFVNGLDVQYANWLGVPRSIKKTSVKPSGTISLLPGETPGIHYPHSQHYIRRIRVGVHSPLWQAAKAAGYHVEPAIGQESSTVVVSFPVKEDYFVRGKTDVSIWEQVSNAVAYQREWADNQVSITVTFSETEQMDVQHTLELFEDQLKGISFLPLDDHGYDQAPYEAISEEQYNAMTSGLTEMDFSQFHTEAVAPKFCDGDACTL